MPTLHKSALPSMISERRSRITAAGKSLALAGLCALLLTACPATGPGYNPGNPGGPQLLSNVGDIPAMPNVVGRFERSQVVAYRPGQPDFSIGYHLREPGKFAVSTVYFYALDSTEPAFQRSLAGQFADASAALKQAYPGANLVEQSRGPVTQGGVAIEGLSATYRFEGPFDGRRRLLASELHVFQIGDHFVKFRISYPWEQRESVAPLVAEFIQQLDWSDPAAITAHLLSL